MSAAAGRRRALRTVGVLASVLVLTSAVMPGSGDESLADGANPAATSGTAVSWSTALHSTAPCPEGTTRSATLGGTHFSTGIPNSRFNAGWVHTESGRGVGGGRGAGSTVRVSDPTDHFHLPWVSTTPGRRTMLAFATRGSSLPEYSRVQVNSVDLKVQVTSAWQGRVYDVTAATDDESGRIGTWVEHAVRQGTTASWYLDNVQYYTCRAADVTRISGADRYATAAAVAARYPAGRPVVYLATGENYPDALSGAALAARDDAPVLLTRRTELPTATAAQLDRLNPGRIVVLGGTTAVSDAVVAQAGAYTSGPVTRIFGGDRFETSAKVAAQFPAGGDVAYVATGRAYPDALAGAALAGSRSAPVLLTEPGTLPDATAEALTALRPARIVVLGGPGSVSNTVQSRLAQYATTGQVSRIAGDDRYETAALVAGQMSSGPPTVYVATGTSFPDALAGSALAGSQGVPVLLTRPEALPAVTGDRVAALGAGSGTVLGGRLGVSPLVMDQLGARVD